MCSPIIGVGLSICCSVCIRWIGALQDESIWRRRRGRINEDRKGEQDGNERKDGEDTARTSRGATHRWGDSKECDEQQGSGWLLSLSSSSSSSMRRRRRTFSGEDPRPFSSSWFPRLSNRRRSCDKQTSKRRLELS